MGVRVSRFARWAALTSDASRAEVVSKTAAAKAQEYPASSPVKCKGEGTVMETTSNARSKQRCSQSRMTRTSTVGWSVNADSSSETRVTTESHSATGLLLPSFSRNAATIKTTATG